MFFINAIYRHSDGTVESTQINSNNKPYESVDFDDPMTFETEGDAKAWTETDAAKEWDLGFGGHFDIWEQKEKTIKEIEEEFGESIEDAIQEFIESCHRVGKDNAKDNIAYFMRENLLAKSEEDEVRRLYIEFDN